MFSFSASLRSRNLNLPFIRSQSAIHHGVIAYTGADDLRYLPHLREVEIRPVFIIGAHRSGTSILYRILAQSGAFNQPSVFDVVKWARLLSLNDRGQIGAAHEELSEYLRNRGVTDRGYDALPVTADSPVEYQVAFSTVSARPVITDSNLEDFQLFCRKLTYLKGGARPLLLKNPYDAKHFLFLRRHIPNARFIFIHRDPAQVISSQIEAINGLLERKNEFEALLVERYRRLFENPIKLTLGRLLYSNRLPFLFRAVTHHHATVCDYIVNHTRSLENTAVHVTYPALCNNPSAVVSQVFEFLKLGGGTSCVKSGMINRRERQLHPRVSKNLEAIYQRTRRFRTEFGV